MNAFVIIVGGSDYTGGGSACGEDTTTQNGGPITGCVFGGLAALVFIVYIICKIQTHL